MPVAAAAALPAALPAAIPAAGAVGRGRGRGAVASAGTRALPPSVLRSSAPARAPAPAPAAVVGAAPAAQAEVAPAMPAVEREIIDPWGDDSDGELGWADEEADDDDEPEADGWARYADADGASREGQRCSCQLAAAALCASCGRCGRCCRPLGPWYLKRQAGRAAVRLAASVAASVGPALSVGDNGRVQTGGARRGWQPSSLSGSKHRYEPSMVGTAQCSASRRLQTLTLTHLNPNSNPGEPRGSLRRLPTSQRAMRTAPKGGFRRDRRDARRLARSQSAPPRRCGRRR